MESLKKLWGPRLIQDIQPSDIQLIRTEMMKRGCKISYIGTFLGLVRSFFKYCYEVRNIACLDPRKIRLPTTRQPEVAFLKPEEVARFIASIDTSRIHGLRFKAFVTTLLDTGMRISEALSLDRDSIDWETKTAFIIGKGGKRRMVMFRNWSHKWIQSYLSARLDSHKALFVIDNPPCEVKRIVPEDMRRYFRIYAKKAGLKRVTPHMLRRTAATTFWANGGDTRDIQLFLGHSKIAITERYLGTDWNKIQKAHDNYLNYGTAEETIAPNAVTKWHSRFDRCISHGGIDRPHAAHGLCDKCYVRRWRKGLIVKKELDKACQNL